MKKENQILVVSLIILVLIVLAIVFYYFNNQEKEITNFEECVAAGFPIMESYPQQCRTGDGKTFVENIEEEMPNELEEYFIEELWKRAVANLGGAMPIEGFDPQLYKGAFPLLRDSDFHNAEAISGRWIYTNNQLLFNKDSDDYITSADGTLTNDGVLTLLSNLERRLNIQVRTERDVNDLLNRISSSITQETFCSDESRDIDACTAIYSPVCGWSDPEKIQCIRYPCAQTYSNSCFACMNDDVLYWTEGECPSG